MVVGVGVDLDAQLGATVKDGGIGGALQLRPLCAQEKSFFLFFFQGKKKTLRKIQEKRKELHEK